VDQQRHGQGCPHDRPGAQRTVVEVLSAFIRDKLDGADGSDPEKGGPRTPEADVLAAVSILVRRRPGRVKC
jgi:hypothetical protein